MHVLVVYKIALFFFVLSSYLNAEVTSAQYEGELTSAQQSLQDSRIQIANEQKKIEELKAQLISLEQRKQRFYNDIGLSEDEVKNTELQLIRFNRELSNISAPHIFSGNDSLLNEVNRVVGRIKASPIIRLKQISTKISELDKLLNSLLYVKQPIPSLVSSESGMIKSEVPMQVNSSGFYYKVKSMPGSPETLISIAKTVYGDPNKWTEIYSANKVLIDSIINHSIGSIKVIDKKIQPADFILPSQVLLIPKDK